MFETNKRGDTFKAHLFSRDQIAQGLPSEVEKTKDHLLLICGDHNSAPFDFYITQKGELCKLDHDDLPNILYSSFHTFVEQYALLNEISDWAYNPSFFNIKSIDSLKIAMSNYEVIPECSDEYNTWWSNGNIMAQTGIWLDRPENYFHVYGRERTTCDELINHLKHHGIVT